MPQHLRLLVHNTRLARDIRRGAPLLNALGHAVLRLCAPALEAAVGQDDGLADDDAGLDRVLAVAALDAVGGDECVGEAGEDGEADDEDHDDVHEGEAVDEGRVVGVVVDELGVGEGEDDADGGGGDVLEEDGPDPVESPVLAGHDGGVDVALELVALFPDSGQQGSSSRAGGSFHFEI